MNGAHLHLILNHTPILGSLAGLLMLLAGVLRGWPSVARTGLVVLVLAALLAVPTLLTGEPAEHLVKPLVSGDARALIHAHEEAAELAFWVLAATGLLAAASLWLSRHDATTAPRLLTSRLALLGALISFGLMARAGNLGGRIMHPESRPDFAAHDPAHAE